jgi:hypothetical protein
MKQLESLNPTATHDTPAAAAAAGQGAPDALPPELRRSLLRAGIPVVGLSAERLRQLEQMDDVVTSLGGGASSSAAAAAAMVADGAVLVDVARKRLLRKAVMEWLTMYNGHSLTGWMTRPKVRQ